MKKIVKQILERDCPPKSNSKAHRIWQSMKNLQSDIDKYQNSIDKNQQKLDWYCEQFLYFPSNKK